MPGVVWAAVGTTFRFADEAIAVEFRDLFRPKP
jgi:hypothetical protein